MSIEIKDIKNLRMAFQAGKSTLNEDELKTLIANSIEKINSSIDQIESDDEDSLIEFHLLFDAIQEGEFAIDFITAYSENEFYSIGNSLIESSINIDDKIKNILDEIIYLYLNFLDEVNF